MKSPDVFPGFLFYAFLMYYSLVFKLVAFVKVLKRYLHI